MTACRMHGLVLLLVLGLHEPVHAIDLAPSRERVSAALEEGKRAARDRVPPDRLYAWFGSGEDLEPKGFLMTKLVGLRVMATHFALRGETPTEAEIEKMLDEPSLLVSVTFYGDRPTFAVDAYVLLLQGDRLIKPIKIRSDGRARRSSAWPRSPAFQAKVVASFPYAEIDPTAKTRISVFPAGGGELSFDLDFSTID
ncbi:hypothetical protein [Candidatus Nitrospira bockiana]